VPNQGCTDVTLHQLDLTTTTAVVVQCIVNGG